MFRVMVTASGSGIGHGIIKAIKDTDLDCEIVATDAAPIAAGLYRGKAGYLVPTAASPDFIDEIIRIARQEEVRAILSGTDYELLPLAENKERIFAETGATVVVSRPDVIRMASDKWLTHLFLTDNGFPSIPSALPEDAGELVKQVGFPLIVKPRIGDSSKNTFVVHNAAELNDKLEYILGGGDHNQYLSGQPAPVIQKYMGTDSQEFTSSSVVLDGEVLGVISMQREMRYPGHTSRAVINGFRDIDTQIAEVAQALQPIGPCNFQSRVVEGVPYIFEINCRFSGTTGICAQAGFNHVEACLRHAALGEPVKPLSYRPGVAIRHFDEVFITREDLERMLAEKSVQHPEPGVHATV